MQIKIFLKAFKLFLKLIFNQFFCYQLIIIIRKINNTKLNSFKKILMK